MTTYYVNKNEQANGDHEVHNFTCAYLPATSNSIYLGDFSNCSDAVREAKKHYRQANGCYTCSRACHTT